VGKYLAAGNIVKSSAFSTWTALSNAIGSEQVTLLVDSSIPITSNITLPATISRLLFVEPGAFDVSSGNLLTIEWGDRIEAAPGLQIFKGTALSATSHPVKFTKSYPATFHVGWWGAKNDYVQSTDTGTDNYPALRAVIYSMEMGGESFNHYPYTRGGIIHFLAGNYYSSKTWDILREVIIEGKQGAGWFAASRLYFARGQRGIVLHRYNTHVDATSSPGYKSGDWSIVKNLALKEAQTGTRGLAPKQGELDVSGTTVTWKSAVWSGTVNTSSTGNTVNWASGTKFDEAWVNGQWLRINGVDYELNYMNSDTQLILKTSPGNQTGVTFSGPLFNTRWPRGTTIKIGGIATPGRLSWVVESVASKTSLTIQQWKGVCSTSGTTVTRLAGVVFDYLVAGWVMNINGTDYTISSITHGSELVLTSSAGTQTAKAFTVRPGTLTNAEYRVNQYHGISIWANSCRIENVTVDGCSGNGINIDTSLLGRDGNENNANNSKVVGGSFYYNEGHGLYTKGNNANSCLFMNMDVSFSGSWSYFEDGFLGNNYVQNHCSSSAGSIWANSVIAANVFSGNYTEGDQASAIFGQYSTVIGGDLGADVDNASNALYLRGSTGGGLTTPIRSRMTVGGKLITDVDGANTVEAYVGQSGTRGGFGLGSADDVTWPSPSLMQVYNTLQTGWWHWQYAGSSSFAFLGYSGSQAAEGGGHLWFPRGFFWGLGGTRKKYETGSAAPSSGTWAIGDVVFNSAPVTGGYIGWVCVTAGSPGTWEQFGYLVPALVNSQTGTSYTIATGDRAKLVTLSNASSVAVTLPQAGASFPSNWYTEVENRGAGAATITPTTSTIDGASSLVLTQHQGVRIFSNGTNYFTQRGMGGGGGAPVGATYIVQTADATLTNEQALGALTTGILKNTTSTGVLSIAAIADLPNAPKAVVRHSANQSINNATLTALSFDTEDQDNDAIHDTATNNGRLTCKTAGFYFIFLVVQWAFDLLGQRQAIIRDTGSAYRGFSVNAGSQYVQVTYGFRQMSVDDWVDSAVYQDSGGSLNVEAAGSYATLFGMVRLGN